MQKKVSDTIKVAPSISKFSIRSISIFIGLFIAYFIFQQSLPVLPGVHQGHPSESITTLEGLSTISHSPLPADHANLKLDIEVEVTEDDELEHDVDCSNSCANQQFTIEERLYTSCIKSRYLRLVSSLDSKTEVPYFILHHSWRSHIS